MLFIRLFLLTSIILQFVSCTEQKDLRLLLGTISKADKVLDPIHFRFIDDFIYLENLSVRLFDVDHRGNYIYFLANRADQLAENRYRIILKEAFFADGSQIEASDVLKSLERTMKYGSTHSNLRNFLVGKGIEIESKMSLIFNVRMTLRELFSYLQLVDYSILHPKQYTKKKLTASDWIQYNSGAYRLKYHIDQYRFERNEKFVNFDKRAPEMVIPIKKDEDVVEQILRGNVDLGTIPFAKYQRAQKKFLTTELLELYSRGHDAIQVLDLNIDSPLFQNRDVRNWFYRKIFESFKIEDRFKGIADKANQFSIPGTLSYLDEKEIRKIVARFPTKAPQILKNGIKIKSFKVMKKFVIDDLEKRLSKALEIPVKIDYLWNVEEYDQKVLKERNYDIALVGRSLNYKSPVEILNLVYGGENPTYKDNGNVVRSLLKELLESESEFDRLRIKRAIFESMINESEGIPLHYIVNPVFYNSSKLDTGNASIDESIKLWKVRVK